MHIIGHVSVAQLIATPAGSRVDARRTFAVILGALTPDLIDKTLMITNVYPWGRTVGHSIFLWILIALVAAFVERRNPQSLWHALALGGFSHMVADFADDLVGGLHFTGYLASAWFTWPYLNPDLYPIHFHQTLVDTPVLGLYTVIEAFVFALVFLKAPLDRGGLPHS